MNQAEALKGIRRAAQERERAEGARRQATNDLRRYCKAAQKAGVPITQVASAAELSRQGVYDLLDRPPFR